MQTKAQKTIIAKLNEKITSYEAENKRLKQELASTNANLNKLRETIETVAKLFAQEDFYPRRSEVSHSEMVIAFGKDIMRLKNEYDREDEGTKIQAEQIDNLFEIIRIALKDEAIPILAETEKEKIKISGRPNNYDNPGFGKTSGGF